MSDREIYIATATSRKAQKWHNEKTTWLELQAKCMVEHYTHETLAEYKAMTKDERLNIKDVGGFVGGYLKDGRRAKGHVEFRDVLTLDIDYGVSDVWNEYTLAFNYASFCYSTHTHTPDKPRIRLVVLLSRRVAPEEYEAIARALAVRVGINYFDDSTYEPERIMFWPSSPKDIKPYHESQNGPALDVDEMLATYHNWKDVSEWAYSGRVVNKVKHELSQQSDPLTKSGIVGAFCRVYSIEEAIEKFLPNVYEKSGNGRYTYLAGSSANGLVLYDNGKFAYSNHSTDPCSQKLCNAFDLVRLHLFGDRDEGIDTKTAISRRPSYEAMTKLATEDTEVNYENVRSKIDAARNDFAKLGNVEHNEEQDKIWVDALEKDKNGVAKSTVTNAVHVLEASPDFKGKIYKSELDGRIYRSGRLLWTKRYDEDLWREDDNAELIIYMGNLGIKGDTMILQNALRAVASRHSKHPICDYLRSLAWDGEPRLEKLFIDFLGAEDNELIRAQTAMQFKGAVARVMAPGCKYDNCLVLSGKQGIGKSTILAKMGGKWFMDSFNTFEGKEAMENVAGSWLIELSELTALANAKNNVGVKSFLSKRDDDFRAAYARVREKTPRQCVFFGTTNEARFLSGTDGNRRFWVVEVGINEPTMSVFEDLTDEYRDQVWAEAVSLYNESPDVLCLDARLERLAWEQQEKANTLTDDFRVGQIEAYLDTRIPADWKNYTIDRRRAFFRTGEGLYDQEPNVVRDYVCLAEICNEYAGLDRDTRTVYKSSEYSALMKQVKGWKYTGKNMRFGPYGVQRAYERIKSTEPNDEEEL